MTKFIGIDGHGGSGKSTFAAKLSQRISAEIIHVDDFTGLIDYPGGTDRLIELVIRPVLRGEKTLSYEPAKWGPTHAPTSVKGQPVTEIMIIEGVDSLSPALRQYISFSVFVDTPISTCFERGTERDKNNYDSIENVRKLWDIWLKKEQVLFDSQKTAEYADIVVDGTKPFDESVESIAAMTISHLRKV